MRRPRPTAPKARPAVSLVSADQLAALAERATYLGSGDHKDTPNFTGSFHPRHGAVSREDAETRGMTDPDCTICPRKWAFRQGAATDLLRLAIRRGQFVAADGAVSALPDRVWAQDPDQPEIVYEGRRLSVPADGYKAYPLTRAQAQRCPFRFP